MIRGFVRRGWQIPSLTRRLLLSIALPMTVLAVALGIGGTWAIEESVESVNDRILGAASRAIAESLMVEEGEIALNLSPAIFGMLENNARDNVYYSVRYRGRLLTGYADLPQIAPAGLSDLQRTFGKGEYLGRPVRIVAEARNLPEIKGPVIIEVAETLDARENTVRRMMAALAILEATLIGFAVVLLPIAVRWGLKPVARVRAELDRRAASDLAPLPLTDVPRELAPLVGSFNAMLQRLDAAVQGMRRFTADASHQMRTPLSILRAHIAVLRKVAPDSDQARQSVADIDQATERLGRLLVQLLALARADAASPQQARLAAVDLNAIAQAALEEHALDATRARIDLAFVKQPKALMARTHEQLAVELVSNLIDNAVRYNRPQGSVTVAVEVLAAGPAIVVSDTGPGIAPADRERVFTRFTRLDRDQQSDGSGLGLPIALSLADAVGATLRLTDPDEGNGLRVEVIFTGRKQALTV